MRSIFVMLLGLALLAGCDQLTGKITPESVAAEIAKTCGIVVTIADLAALLLKEPTSATVAVIANKVCGAFNAKKASGTDVPTSGVITVDGVDLHYTVK